MNLIKLATLAKLIKLELLTLDRIAAYKAYVCRLANWYKFSAASVQYFYFTFGIYSPNLKTFKNGDLYKLASD
jgi:hypothetical protein